MLETQRDTIEYGDMDIPEMEAYIKHTVDQNEAYPAGLYVALTDGSLYHASFVPGPDFDAASKSWYQDGIASEKFILGDVYFDEDSQSYVVGASGRLKSADGAVRGVAAADVYLDFISQIASKVQLEESGGIFLVDKRTDTIIGHRDPEVVGQKLSEAQDSMYAYTAQQIDNGKTGLSQFEGSYIQVAQVPDSDWIAVAYVSRGGSPGGAGQSIKYQSKDELGILAYNFNRTTLRLREYVQYIDEISQKLREIAGGNLAFTLEHDYTGEFEKIRDSLEEISRHLSGTIGQLNTASHEVASGAQQVSSGAVALSQGSAEQAASVQAIGEGFILDVLQNYTTYDTFYQINKEIEEDPRCKTVDAKRQIARFVELHETNIAQRVEVIVEHFRTTVMPELGGMAKAMVITASRQGAVKYRQAFEDYTKKKGYSDIKALVAFSGKVKLPDDETEYSEASMNGFPEDRLTKEFDKDEY